MSASFDVYAYYLSHIQNLTVCCALAGLHLDEINATAYLVSAVISTIPLEGVSTSNIHIASVASDQLSLDVIDIEPMYSRFRCFD